MLLRARGIERSVEGLERDENEQRDVDDRNANRNNRKERRRLLSFVRSERAGGIVKLESRSTWPRAVSAAGEPGICLPPRGSTFV